MDVTLAWTGPVGPGLFPETPEALAALDGAGVYVRVKTYAGGRRVAYVGQSRQLLTRFDQHLVNTLGLVYSLRDEAGAPVFSGDLGARLAAYGALPEIAVLARDEAMRMRFYCAFCEDRFDEDHLDLVEGLLMQRVEANIIAGAHGASENRIAAPAASVDAPLVFLSDFDALEGPDQVLLGELIGAEPLLGPHDETI
jgi:hypothetical protein